MAQGSFRVPFVVLSHASRPAACGKLRRRQRLRDEGVFLVAAVGYRDHQQGLVHGHEQEGRHREQAPHEVG